MSSAVETSGFWLNLLFVPSQIPPLGSASVGMTKRFAERRGATTEWQRNMIIRLMDVKKISFFEAVKQKDSYNVGVTKINT